MNPYASDDNPLALAGTGRPTRTKAVRPRLCRTHARAHKHGGSVCTQKSSTPRPAQRVSKVTAEVEKLKQKAQEESPLEQLERTMPAVRSCVSLNSASVADGRVSWRAGISSGVEAFEGARAAQAFCVRSCGARCRAQEGGHKGSRGRRALVGRRGRRDGRGGGGRRRRGGGRGGPACRRSSGGLARSSVRFRHKQEG